jgi:homoserine kinase type II
MRERLERIVAHFGLGALLAFERAGGYTNTNVFVFTTRGEYLIKVAPRDGDVPRLRQMQAYLGRLSASGFRVVPCLTAKGGDFLFTDGDAVATVQERVDAAAPEALTEDMAAQIGGELGRLHLVPHAGLPARESWLDEARLDRMTEEVKRDHPDAEGAAELIAARNGLFAGWDRLPQAVIHADLYADNTLFRGGRLACLIDWEECGVGAAVLDLGTAVIGCCFPEERFDFDLYAALRGAYEDVRPLRPEEAGALTDAVRYAAVTCAVWRLVNRGRLGDRYLKYWTQGLDRWKAP